MTQALPHPQTSFSITTLASLAPIFAIAALMLAYAVAARQQARAARAWRGWRTASFATGAGLLATAFWPDLARFAHHDLRGHMIQHLLIGMFAPLGLVLGAPLTLAFRALPASASRRVVRHLRQGPLHALGHPFSAMLLNIGGMYVLYLTPLYAASLEHPMVHHLIHLHFLTAGCVFTWSIAGPDPAPRRPGFQLRLSVLFLSIAAHAYLSKLMYAHLLPAGAGSNAEELRAAAKLMYYGGDLAELLLATALFAGWYRNYRKARHRSRHGFGPSQRPSRRYRFSGSV